MISLFYVDTQCLRLQSGEILAQLSEERREKVFFYRFSKDRLLSLAAGCLLDYGLRGYGLQEKTAPIRYEKNGKPYIEGRPLFFNLSHSGNFAACAFSDREIGVDVEKIRLPDPALLERVCVADERRYLNTLEGDNLADQFTMLWTMKESYMKYLGTGLSLDPLELEIDFQNPLTLCHCGQPAAVRFRTYHIRDCQLSVCSEEDDFPSLPTPVTSADLQKKV